MNFDFAQLTTGPAALLIASLAGLAALCIFAFVIIDWTIAGNRRRRRIEELRARAGTLGIEGHPDYESMLRQEIDSDIPAFDRILKNWMPRRRALRARLERTGLPIQIGHYVLICALTGVVAYFALTWFLGFIPLMAGLMAISIGLGLPFMVTGSIGARRVKKFTNMFPDALDLVVRGLRSGLPVQESFQTIARDVADPVGAEFRNVAFDVRLGASLNDALWKIAQRIPTQEFKFFIIAMAVQAETGGNLAETLGNLSDIIRQRRQMLRKIRALSSEARASAMILGSLPFLMTSILFLVSPSYITPLFVDPRGQIMVGVGCVSMLLGIFVMAKMVNFEV